MNSAYVQSQWSEIVLIQRLERVNTKQNNRFSWHEKIDLGFFSQAVNRQGRLVKIEH